MADPDYDPAARRRRYLEERQLKGRTSAGAKSSSNKGSKILRSKNTTPAKTKTNAALKQQKAAVAKVDRLTSKVRKLKGALTETQALLSEKRRSAKKEAKENSDGKTTAKERQANKEYREKNREKLRNKETERRESGGGSKTKEPADMGIEELEKRVSKIKESLISARSQLNKAKTNLTQLAHSAMEEGESFFNEYVSREESVKMTADFGGYATRSDIQCSDGRVILPDAFAHQNGKTVPLVWQHGHGDLDNVLGHVELENRADGVYAHAFFNETEKAQNAKKMVKHGDLKFLSIFANNLIEQSKRVSKGNIREVSLVLAGANPGAYIDNINMIHSDGGTEFDLTEATIQFVDDVTEIDLAHAESDDDTLDDILNSLSPKQETAVNYLLSQALIAGDEDDDEDEDVKHSDTDDDDVEGINGEGENADAENVDGDDADDDNEAGDVQHDNLSQEENQMTHNVFDRSNGADSHIKHELSENDVQSIVADAMHRGSLKNAVKDFALQHGIENIDYLFPDAKTVENSPQFLSRRMEWVDKVLSGVRRSPFSKIKSIIADITPDEARGRGYITGNLKNEEFFALSKRETTPQTIYKKQKLDRDDVVDITDLDVVAFLKAEMKVMLEEEIAGAIIVGDGRSIGSDDKIKETHIRPIASDAELFTTQINVNTSTGIEAFVDQVIANRKHYKGSGQPSLYTTEDVISQFLTVKDNFGRRIYSSLSEVASVLRVAEIVPVEVMDRVPDLMGVIVNLSDYTVGMTQGGKTTMFDDFDIDYNKLKYLIETRMSGALTVPKAALVFRRVANASVLVTPTKPAFVDNKVTVPTIAGVTYKNAETNATLVTATPIELAANEDLHVIAVAGVGYHFVNNAEDEWIFTGEE